MSALKLLDSVNQYLQQPQFPFQQFITQVEKDKITIEFDTDLNRLWAVGMKPVGAEKGKEGGKAGGNRKERDEKLEKIEVLAKGLLGGQVERETPAMQAALKGVSATQPIKPVTKGPFGARNNQMTGPSSSRPPVSAGIVGGSAVTIKRESTMVQPSSEIQQQPSTFSRVKDLLNIFNKFPSAPPLLQRTASPTLKEISRKLDFDALAAAAASAAAKGDGGGRRFESFASTTEIKQEDPPVPVAAIAAPLSENTGNKQEQRSIFSGLLFGQNNKTNTAPGKENTAKKLNMNNPGNPGSQTVTPTKTSPSKGELLSCEVSPVVPGRRSVLPSAHLSLKPIGPLRMAENYEVTDKDSDSDPEYSAKVAIARSKKSIPIWVEGWRQKSMKQMSVDPESIFGISVPECDLSVIFTERNYAKVRKARPKRVRGSSGNWKLDRLRQTEIDEYRGKCGQTVKADGVFYQN
jgi:Inner centromere protein, ARK binding region